MHYPCTSYIPVQRDDAWHGYSMRWYSRHKANKRPIFFLMVSFDHFRNDGWLTVVRLTRPGVRAGGTVTEICVGSGPCGELRYPACESLLKHSLLSTAFLFQQ